MSVPRSPRVTSRTSSSLLQAEVDEVRAAFARAEKDGQGGVDHDDVQKLLLGLGQHPTEEELYELIAAVDPRKTGSLGFDAFARLIEMQKRKGQTAGFDAERDMRDAFAAVSGVEGTHCDVDEAEVAVSELGRVLNGEFELDVDVLQLVERVHAGRTTANTRITYGEFKAMLI